MTKYVDLITPFGTSFYLFCIVICQLCFSTNADATIKIDDVVNTLSDPKFCAESIFDTLRGEYLI